MTLHELDRPATAPRHPAAPTAGAAPARRSRADLLAVVDELGAAADARTTELQARRRLPDDLYGAAVDAGLFRQLVPTELGGLESPPIDWFRAGLALARHEASTAWVVTQGAAELGWIGAGGHDGWARRLLDDPRAVSASSSAGVGSLSIDGTRARLSGRWRFNTGSHGATWIGGLAVVQNDDAVGEREIRWGWVPADRVEILDDWNPSGLHGTGSATTVITDQELETNWTFNPSAPTTNDRGPYRVLVGNGNWPIATSVAAVQLGNARRALDEAHRIVMTKAPMPDLVRLVDNAAVQRALVEADGMWHAARATVEHELEAMWDHADQHGELSAMVRVQLHRANLTANRIAVHIVDSMCEHTGTQAVDHGHILARTQRDANALRNHIAVGSAAQEHNAKVALGLEDAHILV